MPIFPASAIISNRWWPAWCATTASPRPSRTTVSYSALAAADRIRVRQLAALLRIAVALDAGRTQAVRRVEAKIQRKSILLRLVASEAQVNLRELRRKAKFFEAEFGIPVRFACVRRAQNGNGARRPSLLAGRSAA